MAPVEMIKAPENRPPGPPPNPSRSSGLQPLPPRPAVDGEFWRGMLFGMGLSLTIAWLAVIAWTLALWTVRG